MFTNLLFSAVKYAPSITNIEVKAYIEGDQVVISVRDYGIDINEEDLHKIGERFFRAKTSAGIPGTGIRVNLVRTLVDMHEDTHSIESKKGKGSTFTVRLPIAGPSQTECSDTRVA